MDVGNLLTIIGILVSMAFGIWGVVTLIRRGYRGQVSFVREDVIALFDSIVKNLPELSVLYDGKTVGEGLVLLKAAFVNTGRKDITDRMVQERICLSLPERFKWLKARVVASSPKVTAAIDVSPQELKFNIGMFRCREFIRFEALVEVPVNDAKSPVSARSVESSFLGALGTSHRIADTQEIPVIGLPPPKAQESLFGAIASVVLVALVLAIGCVILIGADPTTHFLMPRDNGEITEVRVEPKTDGTVEVKGVNPKGYKSRMRAEDFYMITGLRAKVVSIPPTWGGFFFLWACFSAFFGFFPLLEHIFDRRRQRLRRALGL